jgi:hypothetical protein
VKERTKRSVRLRRTVVVLALGVAIGTLIMATPAAGHFQASIDHIWSHIKAKADKRYLLRPAGTQQEWVAGSTWVNEDGTGILLYGQDSWCRNNGGDGGYLIQQVHLPQGATILKYRAGYKDDAGSAGGNGTAFLTKEALNGGTGSYTDITSVSLPDAVGWTYVDKVLPAPEVVDNKKYAYIFIYSLAGNAGACTAGIYYKPPGSPTLGQPLRTGGRATGESSNPR